MELKNVMAWLYLCRRKQNGVNSEYTILVKANLAKHLRLEQIGLFIKARWICKFYIPRSVIVLQPAIKNNVK